VHTPRSLIEIECRNDRGEVESPKRGRSVYAFSEVINMLNNSALHNHEKRHPRKTASPKTEPQKPRCFTPKTPLTIKGRK